MSKSEARRLIRQGAVSIDGVKITDIRAEVDVRDGMILRIGKRRFYRIVTEKGKKDEPSESKETVGQEEGA